MLYDTGLPVAAGRTYPYRGEGYVDDDFDDGTKSLMSQMS